MATSFNGSAAVNVFAAITLKSAIKMWAKHKMRANRSYTPTAMKAAAERTTGKAYKRGAWDEMVRDLESWIDVNGTRERDAGNIK